MAVKVRADLLATALRVQREFADPSSPILQSAHVDAALTAQTHAPTPPFSDAEYKALLRLRSQLFKAPDKKLKLSV